METARTLLRELGEVCPYFSPTMSEVGAISHRCGFVIDASRCPAADPDRIQKWCMSFDFEQPVVVPVVLTFDSKAIHLTLDPPSSDPKCAASIPWESIRGRGAHQIEGAGLVVFLLVGSFRLGVPAYHFADYSNGPQPPLDMPDDE